MNKIFFFFFYFRQNLLTVNIINLSVALVWVFTVLLYQHCLYTVCNTRWTRFPQIQVVNFSLEIRNVTLGVEINPDRQTCQGQQSITGLWRSDKKKKKQKKNEY